MFINLTDSNLSCLLLQKRYNDKHKNNSQTCFEFINAIFIREKVKEGLINHETFAGELYTPD